MVGGVAANQKICQPHLSISGVGRTMLRWRCDAWVFKPPLIEIIARQKVVPAFEATEIEVAGMDGLELPTTIEQKRSETGAPRPRVQSSV
jgi:hypothetical protein